MTLDDTIQAVTGPDEAAAEAAREHWDSLAKPLGSLGVLEEHVVRIAGLTGSQEVRLENGVLLVFCADNGVIAQGVSQSDASVTAAVASALGRGDSTVNHMAACANCRVIPVNVGMASDTPPGVLHRCVQAGTGDIATGPAMDRETCEKTILTGMELARAQKEAGADILLLGEMGIGNTTTSSAVASVLLGMEPEVLTGRGAGLSDAGLQRKLAAIRRAITVNAPDPKDPVEVLRTVGGLDLAAICGAVLGGALYRVPVLLDGVITNVAALCAVRLCPAARDALLASHCSREPAAGLLLKELGLKPCISAGLRLGEGSGAVLALPLLDQALAVYHSGHTFGALGIDAYTPQQEETPC